MGSYRGRSRAASVLNRQKRDCKRKDTMSASFRLLSSTEAIPLNKTVIPACLLYISTHYTCYDSEANLVTLWVALMGKQIYHLQKIRNFTSGNCSRDWIRTVKIVRNIFTCPLIDFLLRNYNYDTGDILRQPVIGIYPTNSSFSEIIKVNSETSHWLQGNFKLVNGDSWRQTRLAICNLRCAVHFFLTLCWARRWP